MMLSVEQVDDARPWMPMGSDAPRQSRVIGCLPTTSTNGVMVVIRSIERTASVYAASITRLRRSERERIACLKSFNKSEG
ncbi:MAG: hypothetical protein JWL86_5391 [Rhizobium sp.]|nr:hypothetical protein [Rhizobium sp.]